MSARTLKQIANSTLEATASVLWRHWTAVGSMASSAERAHSVVDPEALVLMSLFLRDHERRFWDLLSEWATVGARLLSVQRMKNLAPLYPPSGQNALNEFGALARSIGRDARWKVRFFPEPGKIRRFREKRLAINLKLVEDSALMLRLRRGLGVGLRADVLSFLLGKSGSWASVRAIAHALGYTPVATRRAADDLAAARLIHATVDDQPTTYSADAKAWARILELSGPPPVWRHWNEIFVLAAALWQWALDARERRISPDALNTLGCELLERHRTAFTANEVSTSDKNVQASRGAFGSFDGSMKRLTHWMTKHA